ncbi:MAG: type II toxin-antitoxin system VapC family toxin [Pirellulales bacterium]
MTWLLDANVCIRYLNRRSPSLKAKLDAADPAQVLVCSVVKAEMYFGAARSRDPARAMAEQRLFLSRFRSLPFDDIAAESYAEVRADLTRRGQLIGPNDLMIAAICLAKDVTMVTHNVSEFGRINGLNIEDSET